MKTIISSVKYYEILLKNTSQCLNFFLFIFLNMGLKNRAAKQESQNAFCLKNDFLFYSTNLLGDKLFSAMFLFEMPKQDLLRLSSSLIMCQTFHLTPEIFCSHTHTHTHTGAHTHTHGCTHTHTLNRPHRPLSKHLPYIHHYNSSCQTSCGSGLKSSATH